ncbi:MAG: hypothetical protein QM639_00005 [Rhodocyclaceae bacterium]
MSQDGEKKSDGRWWEFYVVRYFVGTALGAIVIIFLATAESPFGVNKGTLADLLKPLKPDKFEDGYLWLLLTLGMTYCYLASGPVLVLHATRGTLLSTIDPVKWKRVAAFVALLLVVAGPQTWKLFELLRITGNPWTTLDFYIAALFVLLPSLLFALQVVMLWLAITGREPETFKYYDKVVKKRARAARETQEYVESYRHLREHGNAFLIVLLELLLGGALYYSPFRWGLVLMFWIAPAALVWFVATYLESRDF